MELRARGFRDATSVYELSMAGKGTKDPAVLAFLATASQPSSVLVTFDNKMPRAHRSTIWKHKSTLAVIDSKAERAGLTREEYTRDVIHRWAHRMERQRTSSGRKYSRAGSRKITL